MTEYYVNKFCEKVDYRAGNLYTHPQLAGLALCAIDSAKRFEMADGLVFFTENGELAFGYIGQSLRAFLASGRHRYFQVKDSRKSFPPLYSSTRVAGWALDHMFPNPENVSNANDSYGKRLTSFSDVQQEKVLMPYWCKDKEELLIDLPPVVVTEATEGEQEVTRTPVLRGMEVRTVNCDDGFILGIAEYGGWVTALPGIIPDEPSLRRSTMPVALLRKRVPLTEKGRGIQHAYPSMVAGMKKDEKEYFDKGYHHYQRSGASKGIASANICTLITITRSTNTSQAVTGLASPSLYPIPSSNGGIRMIRASGGGSLGSADIAVVSNIPAALTGLVFPEVIECGDPDGSTIVTDVRTGHSLGSTIDYDTGHIVPIMASGTAMDVAMASIGVAYESGVPPVTSSSEPFPPDVDTTGLTEEEVEKGWGSISTAPSKANVANICRMPFGMHLFPQLQDDVAGIYAKAMSEAKKDAKKKGIF